MSSRLTRIAFAAPALTGPLAMGFPSAACAAEGGLDGAALDLAWTAPFMGLLLSIALAPLLAPRFWHHHFGKVSAFWALTFLVPCAVLFGAWTALSAVIDALVLEYVPFVVLLLALYTVAGGVRVTGRLSGTPLVNTAVLVFGTAVASIMGTTGASMLLIRPMLRANLWRRRKIHVIVFFIFLVSNIGGSLSPLGDPPLFLGFLNGVDFFWPARHLLVPMLVVSVLLLALFYLLDVWFYRREPERAGHREDEENLGIEGGWNLLLLGAVIAVILASAAWNPGMSLPVHDIDVPLQAVLRDLGLIAITLASLAWTPAGTRQRNGFTWFPMIEVAKLFAGLFVTIVPALEILRAGTRGALAPLVSVVNDSGRPVDPLYFWLTGGLSSFLDNAPTYLVFFNIAGGDARHLMHELPETLAAISAGAVFMGANTYIGNAPNFMVRSIAESWGVRMPGFFGYMLWSGAILLPLFAVATLLFFR